MTQYSQNNEQHYILEYFKDQQGTFLDIGAYDGVDLSNTRALAEKGWRGACVEASPEIFKRLKTAYYDADQVLLYNIAIGDKNNPMTFWQNDNYYSTFSHTDMMKWYDAGEKFARIDVNMIDFNAFIELCEYKKFDFISLDAEGYDWIILQQMDLAALGCKMICVEHNSVDTQKYFDYIAKFGFKEIHRNAENLIMAI